MTIANLTVANNNGVIFITDNSFGKRTECLAQVMAIEKGIYTFIETANAAAQQDAAYSDAPIHGTFFSKEEAEKAAFNFVVEMVANIENDFAAGYPAPTEQPIIAIEKNAIVMRSANQYGQVAVCYEVEGGYTFICGEQDHANAAAGIYNNGFYNTKNGALNAALNFVEKMYNKVQSMFNADYIAYEPKSVGKYKGEYPSPASYEGNFWLNCADAHRRNLLGYNENYIQWKEASIGLISDGLGEAFWAAFSSNENLSSAEQLQRGLTAIAQLVAERIKRVLALFVLPNIQGVQSLIVQYLPHNIWLIQPKSGTAKVQYIQLKKL